VEAVEEAAERLEDQGLGGAQRWLSTGVSILGRRITYHRQRIRYAHRSGNSELE
jgi:hypothetical protein